MDIVASTVGIRDQQGNRKDLKWPDGWPVPSVGDDVEFPGAGCYSVRTVVWYPEGDETKSEPFVYVVIGPARR